MKPRMTTGRAVVLTAVLGAALSVTIGGVGAASPGGAASEPAATEVLAKDPCPGAGVPNRRIGIQLWNFAAYIIGSFATPNPLPLQQERLDEVLRRLREMGYRNVEPFSFHGLTAAEFKALLDRYGLRAPARHGPVPISTFDQTLREAKILEQEFVGSGGFPAPGISSLENTLATAIVMNELGRRSVANGTGKFYGHNHQGEFRTQYVDPKTGELTSAWELLVRYTDPRYVAFELDVLWATDGGADPVALLERYGDRIRMLHVKDGINVADPANATPVPLGEGEMNFPPILTASRGHVKYYFYEQDPPFGDPTFDPFASAQKGYDYLSCVSY